MSKPFEILLNTRLSATSGDGQPCWLAIFRENGLLRIRVKIGIRETTGGTIVGKLSSVPAILRSRTVFRAFRYCLNRVCCIPSDSTRLTIYRDP